MLIFKTPVKKTVDNILHSAASPDWYTPSPYVEAARTVMGSIDLDPASDAIANLTVKATKYYTEQDNGLLLPWYGNVFVNPPGGQVKGFWKKFVESMETTTQMIWIGFSLEQLQTLQRISSYGPFRLPMCIPYKRIAFVENAAKQEIRRLKCLAEGHAFNPKSSPTHANYIVYSGTTDGYEKFYEVFSQFGEVTV